MLRQIPHERPQTRFVEALPHPVERRAEVVHQLLPRMAFADLAREFRGLRHARVRGLEPE
jgi:hypothetical protein